MKDNKAKGVVINSKFNMTDEEYELAQTKLNAMTDSQIYNENRKLLQDKKDIEEKIFASDKGLVLLKYFIIAGILLLVGGWAFVVYEVVDTFYAS